MLSPGWGIVILRGLDLQGLTDLEGLYKEQYGE